MNKTIPISLSNSDSKLPIDSRAHLLF